MSTKHAALVMVCLSFRVYLLPGKRLGVFVWIIYKWAENM